MQSNKKPHVLTAYLLPKVISVAVARANNYQPPPCLEVFLDRTTKSFSILEVPL
jgi:hypothetical protein